MIEVKDFYDELLKYGADFFAGVPDSTIKDLTAYINDNAKNHIITANEGNAIAIGVGYHLASSKVPVIYMQNSGLGNAINPLLSLSDEEVYHTPMLLIIGYRGEPNTKDEPQHKKQGKVTLKMLECIDVKYDILDISNYKNQIKLAYEYIKTTNKTYALVVKKDSFTKYQSAKQKGYELNRQEAINIVVSKLKHDDIIISTTGHISRELYELRQNADKNYNQDFMCVGSMGHASSIALGIAMQKQDKRVLCFDGDGALLMHTGALGVNASLKPKNYKHIVFNNNAHDSVGAQPTCMDNVDLKNVFLGFGYDKYFLTTNKAELEKVLDEFLNTSGCVALEIKVACGAKKDLLRPKETPVENKTKFMEFLQNV